MRKFEQPDFKDHMYVLTVMSWATPIRAPLEEFCIKPQYR